MAKNNINIELEALAAATEAARGLDDGRLTCLAKLVRQGDLTASEALRTLGKSIIRLAEYYEHQEVTNESSQCHIRTLEDQVTDTNATQD